MQSSARNRGPHRPAISLAKPCSWFYPSYKILSDSVPKELLCLIKSVLRLWPWDTKLSLHNNTKTYIINYKIFFMTQQPVVGQGHHIVEASRSYSDTPHSVGLLWTRNRPIAEISTWRGTTLKRYRRPRSRRDSNPQSQKESGRRHMP